MGGGWPTPLQTVCAGTKAWVCAETGVKMQSWLNLMQFEQRPSSVCSKPEQRIWAICEHQNLHIYTSVTTYLAPPAIAAGNGSSLAWSWGLVLSRMGHVVWRLGLAMIWVWGRGRPSGPFVRAWQAILRLLLLVMVRVLM